MPTDDASPPLPEQKCAECGGTTKLAAHIPRFGYEQPVCRIFECVTCKAVTWIAEAISK